MIGLEIEGMARARVRGKLPASVTLRDTYQPSSAKFPLVTMEVTDHAVNEDTVDSGDMENHAVIDLTAEIFTAGNGKKTQAWDLINTVDKELRDMGFVRKSCRPTPNFADATVYRLTAHYRAVVDKENNLYRR